MMRNTISRTIIHSRITCFRVVVKEGVPVTEEFQFEILGKVTEDQALRESRKRYGKDRMLTVGKIEAETRSYEMAVEDFIRLATVVPNDSEPTQNSEGSETN